MEVAFFWIMFAVIVGVLASSRGRSGFGWFLLSLIISPLLGGLFVLVLSNKKEEAALEAGKPTPATHVKCPDCAEFILAEAKVCRYCGCKLVPQQAQG